jgi:hypothetical protein
MKQFHYDTVLLKADDRLFVFYKYDNRIGYVPADISIEHRGHRYTTAEMMSLLYELFRNGNHPKENWSIEHWYNRDGKFLSKTFVSELSKLRRRT